MSETLTMAQVANKLRHTIGWLQRNRARLEASGFPAPDARIPGHARWVAAQVDAWIDGNRERAPLGTDLAEPADHTHELAERARALGLRFHRERSDG